MIEKNMKLGKRIKQRREELDMTQEELGNAVWLNKSTIQRYETGKISKIKIPIIHAMAKKLDVTPDWLMLDSDEMGQLVPLERRNDMSTRERLNLIIDKMTEEQMEALIVILNHNEQPAKKVSIDDVAGRLHKYADPELIPLEKEAWANAAAEKYLEKMQEMSENESN